MTARTHRSTGAWLALVMAGLLIQCQREATAPEAPPIPPPPPPPPPAAHDAAAGGAPDGPGAREATAPDGGRLPDAELPAIGDWRETNIYKFKLEQLKRCGADTGAPQGSALIGVKVRVQVTHNDLLVASRDLRLESGGVILASEIVDKAPAGCAPLLMPKPLHAPESSGGMVIFRIPPGFNPEGRTVTLAYRPTRWGGAAEVRVDVPACLADCDRAPKKKPPGAGKRAGRP